MAEEAQSPATSSRAPESADQQSTNGFAIASLVSGILWIFGIGSILALVFGYMARKQIAASNGRESGSGIAAAGIVLGWIGIGVAIAFIFVFFISVNAALTDS
jgi:hypothetical protein